MTQQQGYVAVFFYRFDDFGRQILLQKKDRGWRGYDVWTPFGGRIEANETPLQCVVREMKEELGITIASTHFIEMKTAHTTTATGETVPLFIYYAPWSWPLESIRLGEGCGWAFWYADELESLSMQAHERVSAQEVVALVTDGR